MKRLKLIIVALALLWSACEPVLTPVTVDPEKPEEQQEQKEPEQPEEKPQGPVPGEYVLPLVQTTDMHGYIVQSGSDGVHYRLAYVANNVEHNKDRRLLLDGGDIYQGASISNLQDGWPLFVAFDLMDYDAVAVGNHEFDWGLETIVDADATLPDYDRGGVHYVNEVPVLCANLYRNGERVSCTRDYVILEKEAVDSKGNTTPVKIGVIGYAINYAGSIMASKFTDAGYTIKENYADVNSIASELEMTGQCDATIMLIHGAAEAAAVNLGRGSAIDIVLGGHSHQTVSGRTDWGLPYLQGGRYCEHYATADMKFVLGEDGILSFEGVEDLKTFKVPDSSSQLDQTILDFSKEAVDAVSHQLNDVIGYIDVDATNYYLAGSGNRASAIANWMCDIIRRIGEADVAFVNSGGVRTSISLNGNARRDITVANVYEIFPFDNTTYIYDLSYEELLTVFEYSMTSGGSSLFWGMTGLDCHFSGYNLESLEKDGAVIYSHGQWAGDWASRRVRLAVSEYLATSERTDYYTGLPNPLLDWNDSPRLLDNSLVDNVTAVRVLREEAATSGGHLYVDTAPHFIED